VANVNSSVKAAALAIAALVQWVASCGGSAAVSATTLSSTSCPSSATREGRVLSRNSPSTRPRRGLARPAHDLGRAEVGSRKEHDRGPPDMLLAGVAVADDRLQTAAVEDAQGDTNGLHL
jgi:hypothetical protein